MVSSVGYCAEEWFPFPLGCLQSDYEWWLLVAGHSNADKFTHLNAKCSSYLANYKFHGTQLWQNCCFLQIHFRKITVTLVPILVNVAAATVAKLFCGCQLGYESWLITYNCATVLPSICQGTGIRTTLTDLSLGTMTCLSQQWELFAGVHSICGLPITTCNWDQFFEMHDVKFLNSSLRLLAKISGTQ